MIIIRASQGFLEDLGGLSPIHVPGIENIDLSAMISGHTDYVLKVQEILEMLQMT